MLVTSSTSSLDMLGNMVGTHRTKSGLPAPVCRSSGYYGRNYGCASRPERGIVNSVFV